WRGAPAAMPRGRFGRGHRSSIERLERAALRDEADGQQPERDASDVREDRDPADVRRMREPAAALPELERDPDPEEPDGRDLAQEEEEPEEDRRENACPREEEEIRTENRRDRAARADVGDARGQDVPEGERDEGLERRRREPADDVPEQEANLAERVLDVVAEDPEEEHVPDDVHPAAVHEH